MTAELLKRICILLLEKHGEADEAGYKLKALEFLYYRALFTVAFVLMMRIDEVAEMRGCDVTFDGYPFNDQIPHHQQIIKIRIPFRKTGPFDGEYEFCRIIRFEREKEFSIFRNLNKYWAYWRDEIESFTTLDFPGSDYIFPQITPTHGISPSIKFNPNTIKKRLESYIAELNILDLRVREFTMHTFRRGGAMYRFSKAPEKWTLDTIKRWGGWSPCESNHTLLEYLLDEQTREESMSFGNLLLPNITDEAPGAEAAFQTPPEDGPRAQSPSDHVLPELEFRERVMGYLLSMDNELKELNRSSSDTRRVAVFSEVSDEKDSHEPAAILQQQILSQDPSTAVISSSASVEAIILSSDDIRVASATTSPASAPIQAIVIEGGRVNVASVVTATHPQAHNQTEEFAAVPAGQDAIIVNPLPKFTSPVVMYKVWMNGVPERQVPPAYTWNKNNVGGTEKGWKSKSSSRWPTRWQTERGPRAELCPLKREFKCLRKLFLP